MDTSTEDANAYLLWGTSTDINGHEFVAITWGQYLVSEYSAILSLQLFASADPSLGSASITLRRSSSFVSSALFFFRARRPLELTQRAINLLELRQRL
jgi:hypothetical protein